MPHYLSRAELTRTAPADKAAFRSPVPTQIVSNGEYNPLPQTEQQRQVEGLIKEYSDKYAKYQGVDRRQFLVGVRLRGSVPGNEQGVRAGVRSVRGRGCR